MKTADAHDVSVLPYLGRWLAAALLAFGGFYFLGLLFASPRYVSEHERLAWWATPVVLSVGFLVQLLLEWHRLRMIATRGVEVVGTL